MAAIERILLVDDDVEAANYMAVALRAQGHTVDVVASGDECLASVRRNDYEIVITDHNMPGLTGAEVCKSLAESHPDLVTLLLTAHSTVDVATQTIQAGAFDFLVKPVSAEALTIALDRAFTHQRLRRDVKRLRANEQLSHPIEGIIGSSRAMADLTSVIHRAAPSDATIVITGASGTGKELVARALHRLSSRHAEPFLPINCGAMTPSLLESELFGHEAGAFTDATSRVGLFVQARRGTVFLDEIGELPLAMQAKLLRVLQERRVRRVGSDTDVSMDARILVATNRDLETEVEEGRFREDLYHRLNVVTIDVPSLAERRADIPLLAAHFLSRIAQRSSKPIASLSRDAMRRMLDYNWPGNVRELENSLERAVAVARASAITSDDLPPRIRDYEPETITIDVADGMPPLEEVSRRYVLRTLEDANGNKAKAARLLGISRRALYRRL